MTAITATKHKNPWPDCANTISFYLHINPTKASTIIIFISQMQELTVGEVKGLASFVSIWGQGRWGALA